MPLTLVSACRVCNARRKRGDRPHKGVRTGTWTKAGWWASRTEEQKAEINEYARIWAVDKRARDGIKPRNLKRRQTRPVHATASRMVDAAEFLQWFDEWTALSIVDDARVSPGLKPAAEVWLSERHIAPQRIRDARATGQITEDMVDRIVTAAGMPYLYQIFVPDNVPPVETKSLAAKPTH